MSAGEGGGKSILRQVINLLVLITIRFAPVVTASFHHMGKRVGSIVADRFWSDNDKDRVVAKSPDRKTIKIAL